MGHRAAGWSPLDSGLLGLGRWRLHLAPRVLGTTHRFLWRNQLRFRLHRRGLCGRILARRAFVYNRAVSNVNVTVVHNTYNQTVINNNVTVNRVSYSGGAGGVAARPTPAEQSAAREQHIAPTTLQSQHERASGANRALLASANHGTPAIAATAKPGVFSGRDVVAARAAAPNGRAGERPATAAPEARGEGRPA